MGIVAVASFGRPGCLRTGGDDHVNLELRQFGGLLGQPIDFAFTVAVLDRNRLALDIAALAQSLAKCLDALEMSGGSGTQKTDSRDFRRLLRLRGRAKRQEQSAKRKKNDVPSHMFSPVS